MDSNNVYIIRKEDSLLRVSNMGPDGVVIVPPFPKYGRYTFLIDSNLSLYFYSFQEPIISKGVVCGDDVPDTIGLMPNHIFKIPAGMEREFFNENVLKQKTQIPWKSILVASFKDSVKSDFVQYLIQQSKIESKRISLHIRFALPEEREVLKYKLKGLPYYTNPVKN